jgi:hypothetical protein
MAKRKKKSEGAVAMQSPNMPERKSVETEECENGFLVRISHDGKHGYTSKRFVAFSQPEAQRIASQGMSALSSKKKSGGKRKSSTHKLFASKKS